MSDYDNPKLAGFLTQSQSLVTVGPSQCPSDSVYVPQGLLKVDSWSNFNQQKEVHTQNQKLVILSHTQSLEEISHN